MQSNKDQQLAPIRIAVAQIVGSEYPNARNIVSNARAICQQMHAASAAGAQLIQFHEGALSSYPSKSLMSITGPDMLSEADWSKVAWDVLEQELRSICQLAKKLKIWVVLGSIHRFSDDQRPFNSLYIISNHGEIAERYDKRLISSAEISYMYTPGQLPLTFTVEGWSFGCAICVEINYPELFIEYERLKVDCVLFSTYSEESMFGILAQGHAASNSYWMTFSPPTQGAKAVPAGVIAPNGVWLRQAINELEQCVIIDLDPTNPEAVEAVKYRRPWRRLAREGSIYRERLGAD